MVNLNENLPYKYMKNNKIYMGKLSSVNFSSIKNPTDNIIKLTIEISINITNLEKPKFFKK